MSFSESLDDSYDSVESEPPLRSILFVVDVEPDQRKTQAGKDEWVGSEKAITHIERLRDELEEATGRAVELNWFVRADPQIEETYGRADFAAEACPRIMRTIEERRDYAGLHLHLWRWDASRGEWFSDFANADWQAECVEKGVSAFTKMFSRAPEASRVGDRWMSQSMFRLLRDAGISYDLTVEPGLPSTPSHDDPRATAWLPDFRRAPRDPWMPSENDYLVSRARTMKPLRGMWMIPITTTAPRWRLVRRPPFIVRASRSANLVLSTSYVWPLIKAQLDKPSHAPVVIVLRSGDLASSWFMRNFLATTRELVRHPGLAYSKFTNPDAAIARWRRSTS